MLICLHCIVQVTQANSFKNQCLKSDEFLRGKVAEFKERELDELAAFIKNDERQSEVIMVFWGGGW